MPCGCGEKEGSASTGNVTLDIQAIVILMALIGSPCCMFHSECSNAVWNYCVLFLLCDCALHGWGCALLLLSFKVWCDLMGMCGHCKEIRDWMIFKPFISFTYFYWKVKNCLHVQHFGV
jgi:hypothetical protein